MDSIIAVLEPWATHLLLASLSLTALLVLCLPTRYAPPRPASTTTVPVRVVVLVLGDIGRSPRMQYHALSIARKGGVVDLVGYNDTAPRPELLAHPSIYIRALSPPPKVLDTSTPLRFVLYAPFKAAYQLLQLLHLLLYTVPPSAGFLLLQNPPAIPTLVVAFIASRLRRQTMVVDWHNFGYTILQMKLRNHPIVWAAKFHEILFARAAHVNFTVTHAMQHRLRSSWHLTAPIHTLHDRPPRHFQPLTSAERASFLEAHPCTAKLAESLVAGRTKLLVTSTSWTADEDFALFLSALLAYDRVACSEDFLRPGSAPLPAVHCLITGTGPLRQHYLGRIAELDLQMVSIDSVWLEAADYPRMIACADLGVSLHTSSSGLDLPMKVVDLFGVGVPVAAARFESVAELIKDGANGLTFESDRELAQLLANLFHPATPQQLRALKLGALGETSHRWDENWDKIAGPMFGL